MRRFFEPIFGISIAVFIRGMRFGLRDAYHRSRACFATANPLANQQLQAIPEVHLDEILGTNDVLIKLRVIRYEDGQMPRRDAISLLSIALLERPSEVLEIGTYMGHTTRALAENLPLAIIHTVDLPPDFSNSSQSTDGPIKDDFHLIAKRVVGREFKGRDIEARVKQHFGDTAHLDFVAFGRPTFFFIDGSHTYDYCKNDSEKCMKLCGDKGTFLWHDCDEGHPGVVRYLSELRGSGKDVVRIEGTDLAYWKCA